MSKGTDGKYKIDTFSNKEGNIDFNNMIYTGDTEGIFCGSEDNSPSARRMRGNQYLHVHCDEKKEFFREKTTSPNVNGVISTEYREVNLVYTRSLFLDAAEEALLTSGIDRSKTIALYDSYVEKHDKRVTDFKLPPNEFYELLKK